MLTSFPPRWRLCHEKDQIVWGTHDNLPVLVGKCCLIGITLSDKIFHRRVKIRLIGVRNHASSWGGFLSYNWSYFPPFNRSSYRRTFFRAVSNPFIFSSLDISQSYHSTVFTWLFPLSALSFANTALEKGMKGFYYVA